MNLNILVNIADHIKPLNLVNLAITALISIISQIYLFKIL